MGSQRILVIEDDEEILELLRYSLSREGYRVECAASGEEGLRLARQRPRFRQDHKKGEVDGRGETVTLAGEKIIRRGGLAATGWSNRRDGCR